MKKVTFIMLMALFAMTASASYSYQDNVEIGNLKYTLAKGSTSSEEHYAQVTGLSAAGASVTNLFIAGYVTYNSVRYRVKEIKPYAFKGNTKLVEVHMGYGVTDILGSAFANCTALTILHMPSSINYVGGSSFAGCTKLNIVSYAGDKPPTMGDNAFANTASTKYLSTATYRGANAMKANSAWSAVFSSIGKGNHSYAYDFQVNNVHYTIQKGFPYSYGTSTCTMVGGTSNAINVTLKQSLTDSENNAPGYYKLIGIADSAFLNHNYITSVLNDNTMANFIGKYAFANTPNLTKVYIAADSIKENAFAYCPKLTTVKLYGYNESGPNGVEYIGTNAFREAQMTSITIPASVKYIGSAPFFNCDKLASITVASGNANYSSQDGSLFNYDKTILVCCPQACPKLTLPVGLKTIGYMSVRNNTKITSAFIPHGVTAISSYAFSGCTNLKEVHIPSSVTQILGYAFAQCTSLKAVYSAMSAPATNYTNYFTGLTMGNIKLYRPLGYKYLDYVGPSYDLPKNVCYANNYHKNAYWKQLKIQSDTSAYDYELNGLRYILDPSTKRAAVVGTERTDLRYYKIDDTFNYNGITYTTTVIADSALIHQSADLSIEGGTKVKVIGTRAFYTNEFYSGHLNYFPFLNVEHVLDRAFWNAKFTSIVLEKAYCIKEFAFAYNVYLTSVITGEHCVLDGVGHFYNCNSLTDVFVKYHVPNSYVRDNVQVHPDALRANPIAKFSFGALNEYGNFALFNSNITVWVDYRNSEALSWSFTEPFFVSEDTWQSFAAAYEMTFDNVVAPTLYLLNYEANQGSATIKKMTLRQVYGTYTGGHNVVKCIPGTYYKMKKGSSHNPIESVDHFGGSYEELLTDVSNSRYSTAVTDRYVVEPERPYLRRLDINEVENVPRGGWIISWPRDFTHQQSTIQMLLPDEGAIAGDVNDDGVVSSVDITILYNYLLNGTTEGMVNGDQDGDGIITSVDITIIYNILLGNN